MDFEAASVSDLVASIKDLLEDQFQEVMVQGEVTNLSPSSSGHWYFTLSDENACISCALFRMDALRNPLIRQIKDGDKIVVLGPLSVYQKRGSFQLLAKRILPSGAGQLKLQYERLKSKLAQEGLFDLERKKKIPAFPRKIAVITAEHGAALQDFLNVIKRRSLWFDVLVVPALVQGEGAAKSVIAGLEKSLKASADVIVITRGGGSFEDLWPFNDEGLVRAISHSPVPVISAVGHQVDFTLCDYVADARSETPTAAAEMLSQPQTELKSRLHFCQTHLKSELHKISQHIQLLGQRFHPRELMALMWEKIQRSQKRLLSLDMTNRAPELVGYREASQRLDESQMRLLYAIRSKMTATQQQVKRLDQVLGALDPRGVLKRGYSYIEVEGGEVITSLQQYKKLAPSRRIQINFQDGQGLALKET